MYLAVFRRLTKFPYAIFCRKMYENARGSEIKHLNQKEAISIDVELFSEYGFALEQLVELAGMSCAHSIAKEFTSGNEGCRVLVLAGPGNNGKYSNKVHLFSSTK